MAAITPEKHDEYVVHDEAVGSDGQTTPPQRELVHFDEKEERKLIRKIDRRLLPILGALYAVAIIDRVNISAARISGMDEDLKLYIGDRYTIVLCVFFPPYLLLEFPSNIILRKVGPAKWLSFLGFAWGTVMLGQGFVKHYGTLAFCRVLLGAFEAGFFPGSAYLITCWYVRYETQQRLAWFYLSSTFIGGFSSLLAYGLIHMAGLAGLNGWQWIFIIEGVLTQVVAILAFFLIVDFPDRAYKKGMLTEQEATFVAQRIDQDRGDAVADKMTTKVFFHHLMDLKLWAFALMFMCTAVVSYALAYFGPVIVHSWGYSVGVTHLLGVAPVTFSVIWALITSWASDRLKMRYPFIFLQAITVIVGLMMVAYCENNIARYWGIFFGFAGSAGNTPSILTYQSNNIRTQTKRAVGSALQIGFGAIGGVLGSTVFQQKDAPKYLPGLFITTGLQILLMAILTVMTLYFRRQNKKADRGEVAELEGQPGFRYTL